MALTKLEKEALKRVKDLIGSLRFPEVWQACSGVHGLDADMQRRINTAGSEAAGPLRDKLQEAQRWITALEE